MKKTVFIKNAAVLTATSLILRFAGISFKVWLAGKIGADGIGLYQLVFSVYVFASAFASSGICTAVTRLVAEEAAIGSRNGISRIMRRCTELTLIIAMVSCAVLFFGADFISSHIIGDIRASQAIKILCFSLPFMGICSCLRGYFIAVRRASPSASSQLIEQAVRIVSVMIFVSRFAGHGLSAACGAVLAGDVTAEAASCLYLYARYRADKSRRLAGLSGRKRPPYGIVRKIIHIALPITAGRYLNSALRTAENILVPKNLAKAHSGTDSALSLFGSIKGMALPVLFFPSSLLSALSTLLIPEMSEALARGRKGVVRCTTEQILKLTSLVSFIFAAVFFAVGDRIGILLYGDTAVGYLLTSLAPIVPLMYLDSISDGILKGLDQQRFSFWVAILDSSLRIVLVIALLPRFGIKGFIGIMYFSNLLTCLLNVGRLIKISGAKIDAARCVIFPILSALIMTFLAQGILKAVGGVSNLVYIIVFCAVSASLYFLSLFAFKSLTLDDVRGIIK